MSLNLKEEKMDIIMIVLPVVLTISLSSAVMFLFRPIFDITVFAYIVLSTGPLLIIGVITSVLLEGHFCIEVLAYTLLGVIVTISGYYNIPNVVIKKELFTNKDKYYNLNWSNGLVTLKDTSLVAESLQQLSNLSKVTRCVVNVGFANKRNISISIRTQTVQLQKYLQELGLSYH